MPVISTQASILSPHVMPAKAGIHGFPSHSPLDPGLRRDDELDGIYYAGKQIC
jgi:hypothetical protein